MDIKQIVIGLRQLEAKVLQESLRREEVKASAAYEEFEKNIAALKKDQAALLEGIEDSSIELEDKKRELMDFMIQTNVSKTDEVELTYKTKKEVNIDRAREKMGDDIMAYVKVTQKDLKDYADQFKVQNPAYAKDIMSCIEIVSQEPSGIKIL
jgi:hypothetical protein